MAGTAAPGSRPSICLETLTEGNPRLAQARSALERSGFDFVPRDRADVVLMIDNGYCGFAELPRVLRIADGRAMAVYSETDWPYPVFPGLYPSLTRAHPSAASWPFVLDDIPAAAEGEPDLLYSWIGRVETHPVRKALLTLDRPDAPVVTGELAPARFAGFDYRRTYWEILCRSRFVLCPRGFGAGSIRLSEVMAAGRVPVIIADAWQQPPVGDWSKFAVRVRERDVAQLPERLFELSADAAEMGRLARSTYLQHFTWTSTLDRLVSLAEPQSTGGLIARATRAASWREFKSVAAGWRQAVGKS